MPKKLIELKKNIAISDGGSPGWVDPFFLLVDTTSLIPPADCDHESIDRYLAHRITRNSLDLKAHVQRIHLHLLQRDSVNVHGALLDLFIALEDKGHALRRHLLKLCMEVFDPVQQKQFQDYLDNGISSSTVLKPVESSLLHSGMASTLPLITRAEQKRSSADSTDALSESREYLEYGQLEQAMSVLEEAVLSDPFNKAYEEELIMLYRHARAKQRYKAQTHAMLNAKHILSKNWIKAEKGICQAP